MTTLTQKIALPATASSQAVLTLVAGVFLLFAAGFAQSGELHAATHDSRHATGFPCH